MCKWLHSRKIKYVIYRKVLRLSSELKEGTLFRLYCLPATGTFYFPVPQRRNEIILPGRLSRRMEGTPPFPGRFPANSWFWFLKIIIRVEQYLIKLVKKQANSLTQNRYLFYNARCFFISALFKVLNYIYKITVTSKQNYK